MFCNELVSDAADDGAAVPSASFSENEVVKLAKDPGFLRHFHRNNFFSYSSVRRCDLRRRLRGEPAAAAFHAYGRIGALSKGGKNELL